MAELKKGDRVNLTSGGYVSIDKELGRGGQGIVYLVDLKGEKKVLNWYLNVPDDKFYKNLEHNIMGGAPSAAFLWPEYLTKKEEGSYGYVMKLRSQNYFEFGNFLLAKKAFRSYTAMLADARVAYETTMASANAEYAKDNYIAALNLFHKAENEYEVSYSVACYKQKAHDKAIEATNQIVSDWKSEAQPLLQTKKVAQVKSLSEQIDNELATRTTEIVDELFNDIYVHHETLSGSGKQELDEMIKVVPDNYWLNFIKERAK